MVERAMTEAERAELAALLPGSAWHLSEALLFVMAICTLSALAGLLATALLTLMSWLTSWATGWHGVSGAATRAVSIVVGCSTAAGASLVMADQTIRRGRLRRAIAADLHNGIVDESTAEVASLVRLREPEHFTELLILACTDGRLRAVLDDTTTNTEGHIARRSRLKLGRQVSSLRLRGSGTEMTRFSGVALRRPPAILSDPRTWPSEGWITPDDLAQIDGATPERRKHHRTA
jgi:hypothetical protein